jgi:hypothetical protein
MVTILLILPEGPQAQSFFGAGNSPANNPYLRGELGRRMAYEQAQARSKQRQKRLVSDTDKLIRMVKDLQIDMRNEDMSPSDLTRRAAEIEKLAHSVQNSMKGDS